MIERMTEGDGLSLIVARRDRVNSPVRQVALWTAGCDGEDHPAAAPRPSLVSGNERSVRTSRRQGLHVASRDIDDRERGSGRAIGGLPAAVDLDEQSQRVSRIDLQMRVPHIPDLA